MNDLVFDISSVTFDWLLLAALVTTVVLVATAGISALTTNQSASKRFLVWRTGLLLAVSLPVAMALMPKFPLGFTLSYWSQPTDVSAIRMEDDAVIHIHPLEPQPASANSLEQLPTPGQSTQATVITTFSRNQAASQAGQSTSVTTEKVAVASVTRVAIFKLSCTAIWLLFTSLLLLRVFAAQFVASGWRRRSKRNETLGTQCVFESNEISTPMVVGILRPAILLPTETQSWPKHRMQMVLEHELAHIERHDVFWRIATAIIKSVFWFQPLLWLTSHKMNVLSEQACDDKVIRSGADAESYATELLELATSISSQSFSVAAITFSQPPFETRLKSILNNDTTRDPSSNSHKAICWIVLLMALIAFGSVRPLGVVAKQVDSANAFEKQKADSEANSKALQQFPKTFTGRLMDREGNPVAGATFELMLMKPVSYDLSQHFTLAVWKAVSNSKGEFNIAIKSEHFWEKGMQLSGYSYGQGYVEQHAFIETDDAVRTGKLGDHELHEGRLVRGRVIEPETDEYRPIEKPWIKLMYRNYIDRVACNPDGTFETWVPKVATVKFIAGAKNYAEVSGFVETPDDPESAQELGDIVLNRGSSVFGKVIDKDGKPVAGQVIEYTRTHEIAPPNEAPWSWSDRITVITDEKGAFTLPPQTGHCSISLATGAAWQSDEHCNFVKASRTKPPVVKPVGVLLDNSGVYTEINLRAAETITVSGTVRNWLDDSPAINVHTQGTHMQDAFTPQGRHLNYIVSGTTTDNEGRYEVEMLKDQSSLCVNIWGFRRGDEQFTAYPVRNIDAIQKSAQILVLKNEGKDLTGIDWVLVSEDQRETFESSRGFHVSLTPPLKENTQFDRPPAVPEADRALIKISDHYYSKSFNLSLLQGQAGKNKEAREDVSEKQKSFEAKTVEDLLRFEEKYRGDVAAINALEQIIELQNGRPRDQSSLAAASARAIEVASKHYVDNEHLWLMFDTFQYAGPEHYPRELIQKVQQEAPFPANRGRALYSEAMYDAEVISTWRELKQRDWEMDHAPEYILKWLTSLNIEEYESRLKKNLDEIQSRYAGTQKRYAGYPASYPIRQSFGRAIQSFIKREVPAYAWNGGDATLDQSARTLEFKMFGLVEGKKFPLGRWNDPVEAEMATVLGKSNVLLLATFTLPANRWREQLQRALKVPGLHVVLLRSNGDWSPLNTFEEDQAGKEAPTLPANLHVIYDDTASTYAIRWGSVDSQAAYFINKAGILRARGSGLYDMIEDLESGKFE